MQPRRRTPFFSHSLLHLFRATKVVHFWLSIIVYVVFYFSLATYRGPNGYGSGSADAEASMAIFTCFLILTPVQKSSVKPHGTLPS